MSLEGTAATERASLVWSLATRRMLVPRERRLQRYVAAMVWLHAALVRMQAAMVWLHAALVRLHATMV